MKMYRIKIGGVRYFGIFCSHQAAAADAELRFPDAWGPQVVRIGVRHG